MINFHKLGKYTLALLASLVLITSISLVQRKLDDSIRKNDLFFTGQINNAPPIVAFTTLALGSFRGLLGDILWLRASGLQEDKNYFEMVQLASWITKLQPRFASATAFLAWNMSYNISITCSLWQDRWYWVWEGAKLIRDEAILYNPESGNLYYELALILQQKLGSSNDYAQYYYKGRLANEIEAIVTLTPDWEFLGTMPSTEEEFKKLYPADDPLWDKLRKAGFEGYSALLSEFKLHGALPEKLQKSLKDEKSLKQLEGALRTGWLYEKFKLRASRILELNKEYGDIDWRLPEAQALYWAAEGVRLTKQREQCMRIISTSLQEMMRGGRIMWREQEGYRYLLLAPNLDLVKSAIRTYEWAFDATEGKASSFKTGKINFMKNALIYLFYFGRFDETKEVFAMLKKEDSTVKYPPFEDFLLKEIKELLDVSTLKQIQDLINAFIQNALNAAVNENEEQAMTYEVMARKVYSTYQAGISEKEQKRLGLPPYNEIRDQVVKDYLAHADPRAAAIVRAKIASQKAEKEREAAEQKR